MFLSAKTVANNVSNILAKLHLAERAQAIVAARDAGLGRRAAEPRRTAAADRSLLEQALEPGAMMLTTGGGSEVDEHAQRHGRPRWVWAECSCRAVRPDQSVRVLVKPPPRLSGTDVGSVARPLIALSAAITRHHRQA